MEAELLRPDVEAEPIGQLAPRTDPAEADRLTSLYASAIYRLAVGLLNDAALAEDVVQETLFRAWQHLDDLREPTFERAWVLRIAHNMAVTLGRRRRDVVTQPHEMPEQHTDLDPERIMIGRYDLSVVEAALDELDDRSRSIVVLREVEQLPIAEIAAIVGLPEPATRTRLFRARAKLKETVLGGPR